MGENKLYNKWLFGCLFIMIFLIVSGCEKADTGDENGKTEEEPPLSEEKMKGIQRILVEDEQFSASYGWSDDETIIYATEGSDFTAKVFLFNIKTGENKPIFKSEHPIVDIIISPERDRMVVNAAPSTYEALLTIIDNEGNELFTYNQAASELNVNWNPYNSDLLLVSAFAENWEFATVLIDLEGKTTENVYLKEPFVQWFSEKEVVYMDWSMENPALFAPLIKQSIWSEEESVLLQDIYYMHVSPQLLMTITVSPENTDKAQYTFMNRDNNHEILFVMPQLSRYSDWLIPYADMLGDQHYLTFRPLYSGAADTYSGGFELIAVNVNNGEEKTVMEQLSNEPIQCSPNGAYCLYGFYLDKIIIPDEKRLVPLLGKEIIE